MRFCFFLLFLAIVPPHYSKIIINMQQYSTSVMQATKGLNKVSSWRYGRKNCIWCRCVFMLDVEGQRSSLWLYKWADSYGASQPNISTVMIFYALSICRMFSTFLKETTNDGNNSRLFAVFCFFWAFFLLSSLWRICPHLTPSAAHASPTPSNFRISESAVLHALCFAPKWGGTLGWWRPTYFPEELKGTETAKWGVNIWSLWAPSSKSHLMLRGILLTGHILNIQSNQSDERVGVRRRS